MAQASLRTALGNQSITNALKDGRVTLPGRTFEFVEHPSILTSVRNLCRGIEDYDICEMPLTTYLVARELGLPFTAIPVVVVRSFPQGRIFVNADAGIAKPKDLDGKRAGIRAYTVTLAVWARGILADVYGVDLESITWVTADEEHASAYVRPKNVEAAHGQDQAKQLTAGQIDAAIGVPVEKSPTVRPLFADGRAEERAWYEKTGMFCANHTVLVADRLTRAEPAFARTLFDAFERARALGLKDGPATDMDRELFSWREAAGRSFMEYGLEPNRKVLSTLLRYCSEQHLLRKPTTLEDVFLDVSR